MGQGADERWPPILVRPTHASISVVGKAGDWVWPPCHPRHVVDEALTLTLGPGPAVPAMPPHRSTARRFSVASSRLAQPSGPFGPLKWALLLPLDLISLVAFSGSCCPVSLLQVPLARRCLVGLFSLHQRSLALSLSRSLAVPVALSSLDEITLLFWCSFSHSFASHHLSRPVRDSFLRPLDQVSSVTSHYPRITVRIPISSTKSRQLQGRPEPAHLYHLVPIKTTTQNNNNMYTLEKLSLALVASLATGAQAGLSWQHRRHLHLMPRDGNYDSHNTTMVGPSGTAPYGTAPMGTGPMTTSVIYATSVVTVTSCGPTVTACPASSTVLSTVVVPVSTTTCPVSGPTAPHGTGIPGTGSVANPSVTTPPSPPLGTGVTPHINSTATTTMTEETNSTLTYTIGAGSSTSVVTTTLKVQTTRTQTSVR